VAALRKQRSPYLSPGSARMNRGGLCEKRPGASAPVRVRATTFITDGLQSFLWGVEKAFGVDCDYGMLIKNCAEREGDLELVNALPRPISGGWRRAHLWDSSVPLTISRRFTLMRQPTRQA
jgi:hypothetical protein